MSSRRGRTANASASKSKSTNINSSSSSRERASASERADRERERGERDALASLVVEVTSSTVCVPLSEILPLLDQVEAKFSQSVQTIENQNESVQTLSLRYWSYSVALRLQILRLIGDILGDAAQCHKQQAEELLEEAREELSLMEECYVVLLERGRQLPKTEDKRAIELYLRLNQFCCNMGFKLQKKKCFDLAVVYSERTLETASLWEDLDLSRPQPEREKDKKLLPNTRYPKLLLPECLRLGGKFEESLSWLARLLLKEAEGELKLPTTCYDVYEQIPWTETSTHWIACYRDALVADEHFDKICIDFLPEIEADEWLKSRVMKIELNCHFTGRTAIPSALIRIGDALLSLSQPYDNVLGYIAKSCGLYFGTPEHVELSVDIIHQCAEFIQSEEVFQEPQNLEKTSLLTALTSLWQGITFVRHTQLFAHAELEILRKQLASENPEREKERAERHQQNGSRHTNTDRDRDTGEELRGASGFSSVTLQHEKQWVDALVLGIEILFRLVSSGELIQTLCTELQCPSMLLISCRISACLLSAIGHSVYASKAWYIVNKLATLWGKSGLQVLSSSEILKIVPDLQCEAVLQAEKANCKAMEGNLIKHNRAYSVRLDLGKALACSKMKMYAEGIPHLLKVFDWLETQKDNFDSTHHLMGEANYVLALYMQAQYSNKLDLSSFPQSLVKMSPAGVCGKGYKTICGMTRDVDCINSAWTDMLHNFYMLSSLMAIGLETIRLLSTSGRTREMRCYVTDAVNCSQHCGFVSRTLQLLVPLIPMDLDARNFLQAQMKLDVINQVLRNSDCQGESEDGLNPNEEMETLQNVQKLVDNMKLSGLTVERLETESDLKWCLKSLEIPSLYYRNRSEKSISQLKKDLRGGSGSEFGKNVQIPPWTRHSLTCSCYICTSPHILPTTFTFFHVQAQYLNCMSKAKSAFAVLESAKLCHERAIFRLIYNLSQLSIPLEVVASSRKIAMKSMELLYTGFCVEPGLNALMTQMSIYPSMDIKMILSAMKKALLVIDTLDQKDYIGKSFPWELGICALHEYLVTDARIQVDGHQLQAILASHIVNEEKENKFCTPNSHSPNSISSPSLKPQPTVLKKPGGVPRKGLKAVGKTGRDQDQKKVFPVYDVEDEDRHIPHLPILTFEEGEVEVEEELELKEEKRENEKSSQMGNVTVRARRTRRN